MKIKFWTFLAAMISTSLLADQAGAPSTPPPVMATTNVAETPVPHAPVKTSKKKAAAKPAKKVTPTELRTVPLVPGPAIVAANRVNVRGQEKLKSEVLGRMTNGEPVTVIEEIHLTRSGPDEP